MWIASAAFSRKKLQAAKEKDGILGVIIIFTTLLFFVSMFMVIVAAIYAGENYEYGVLDFSVALFFSVAGILLIEFIVGMFLKKSDKI